MLNAEEEGYEVFQEVTLILSVSEERYEEFKKETKLDAERQADRTMVMNGSPDTKEQVPIEARPYWSFRDEVAVADGFYPEFHPINSSRYYSLSNV